MERVGTVDPAASGIAPAQRIEVDIRVAGHVESAAAGSAGDRAELTVTNSDRAELGIGWLDQWSDLPVSDAAGRWARFLDGPLVEGEAPPPTIDQG